MFDKPSGTITVAPKGNGLPVAIKFDEEMNDFIEQYLIPLAGRE